MKNCIALAVALTISIGAAAAQTKPDPQKPLPKAPMTKPEASTDEAFAQKVAVGGTAEIALAAMAKQKAASAEVKKLAGRLHDDHTKVSQDLKQIASKNGWTLKTAPGAEQEALKSKLEKLSAAAFDRAYVDAMVEHHEKNIQAFEQQASTGTNDDLKRFASSTLPTLKTHLEMARECQRTLTNTR
jgi:putative membrane protein